MANMIYQWYLPNETTLMGVVGPTNNEVIRMEGVMTYDNKTGYLTCTRGKSKYVYVLNSKHIEKSRGTLRLEQKSWEILDIISKRSATA